MAEAQQGYGYPQNPGYAPAAMPGYPPGMGMPGYPLGMPQGYPQGAPQGYPQGMPMQGYPQGMVMTPQGWAPRGAAPMQGYPAAYGQMPGQPMMARPLAMPMQPGGMPFHPAALQRPLQPQPVQAPGVVGEPIAPPASEKKGEPTIETIMPALPDSLPGTYVPGEPLVDIVGGRDTRREVSDLVRYQRPHHEHFWGSADYMLSWIRRGPGTIPLVTTGSAADTSPGAIGQPNTTVLFGTNNFDYGTFQGAKSEIGLWLDYENRFSFEIGGFYQFQNTVGFGIGSSAAGFPPITRPVINTQTGNEVAFLSALPNIASGGLTVSTSSQLFGGELNARCHMYCHSHLHFDALLGARYLQLQEDLTIRDQFSPLQANALTFLGNSVNAPNSLADFDRFGIRNSFYGMQVGSRARYEQEWFTLDVYGKVAFGVNSVDANIDGRTTLITPAGNQSAPGGILALPSNIGDHHRNVFSIVPEVGINLGVDVMRNVRVKVGYSTLLWTHVTRPGSVVDRNVNIGQIPSDQNFGNNIGTASPTFAFRDSVFWMHSFNLGLEMHY